MAPDTGWRPPALIAQAAWAGSLAAIRALGSAGIPVYATHERRGDAGRWSRHVQGVVRGPRADGPGRFLDWLLARGRRSPGAVLIPTGDTTAWLYSHHRDDLAQYFRMGAVAPFEALLQVIDKGRLARAARGAGLEIALSWTDDGEEPLESFLCRAGTDRFWLKPRTQAGLITFSKGRQASGDVAAALAAYAASFRYDPEVTRPQPELGRPMVQVEEGSGEPLYHLTGFVDRQGCLRGVRAARKPLYRNGFGLLFESAPVDSDLLDRVEALCRAVGYFGMFEAEFLAGRSGPLLTDFNTRCYRELAFDVARGLPLPQMAYALAVDDQSWLDGLSRAAAKAAPGPDLVWIDHVDVWRSHVTSAMGRGRPGVSTRRLARGRRSIDPFLSRSDPLPGVVRLAAHLKGFARLGALLAAGRVVSAARGATASRRHDTRV